MLTISDFNSPIEQVIACDSIRGISLVIVFRAGAVCYRVETKNADKTFNEFQNALNYYNAN